MITEDTDTGNIRRILLRERQEEVIIMTYISLIMTEVYNYDLYVNMNMTSKG